MHPYRPLQVRDHHGTLWAFFREYEGLAVASFEGNLAGLKLNEVPGYSTQETPALTRQTLAPVLDFCTIPINPFTVAILKEKLARPNVLGDGGAVIHTHIKVSGQAVLVACDYFHDECTVASSVVPESFLRTLKARGLLRDYEGDA